MSLTSRPPDRYGDDQPTWHRTVARALVATLAVLGVAWVVWVGISHGSKPASATVVTYHVVDAGSVDAALDVTTQDGAAAACDLEARSRHHLPVGTATVQIPAAEENTRRVNVTIRTQEESASVVVTACRLI